MKMVSFALNLVDLLLSIEWQTLIAMAIGGLIPLLIARHMFSKKTREDRLKESRKACVDLIIVMNDFRMSFFKTYREMKFESELIRKNMNDLFYLSLKINQQVLITRLMCSKEIPDQLLLDIYSSSGAINEAINSLGDFDPEAIASGNIDVEAFVEWRAVNEPKFKDVTLKISQDALALSECFRQLKQ